MLNKIRVLYVHHGTGWGGAPKSLIEVINALNKDIFDIEVLLIKDSIVSKYLSENDIKFSTAKSFFYKHIYTLFVHSEASYIKWYQFYKLFRYIFSWFFSRFYFANKELLHHKFDIVHLNSLFLSDWLAASKALGKTVVHVREPLRAGHMDLFNFLIKSQLNKYADKIIAISKDNSSRIGRKDKTEIVYNFCDQEDVLNYTLSYDTKQILYLGGSSEIKGFMTLINSLDYLNDDVKILFAGDYTWLNLGTGIIPKIKKVLYYIFKNRFYIGTKIMLSHRNSQYIGKVKNVSLYLGQVSCLVSPFTKPHFSRPIIEAYLSKKCVIASDIEGIEEIVTNEYSGLTFKEGDSHLLASIINKLVDNPEILEQYGTNGYNFAFENFTSRRIVDIEKLYKDLSFK